MKIKSVEIYNDTVTFTLEHDGEVKIARTAFANMPKTMEPVLNKMIVDLNTAMEKVETKQEPIYQEHFV